jgi:hypothetical protein
VRDAFLGFLLLIALALLAAVVPVIRWGWTGDWDGDSAGFSVVGAVILIGAAVFVLVVVGGAVGVVVPGGGK